MNERDKARQQMSELTKEVDAIKYKAIIRKPAKV